MTKRDKKFLTLRQLRKRWGNAAQMTIERRLRDDPDFPKPIRLIGRVRMFDEEEVEAYERRAAAWRKR